MFQVFGIVVKLKITVFSFELIFVTRTSGLVIKDLNGIGSRETAELTYLKYCILS